MSILHKWFNGWHWRFFDNIEIVKIIRKNINDRDIQIDINTNGSDEQSSTDNNLVIATLRARNGNIDTSSIDLEVFGATNVVHSRFDATSNSKNGGNITGQFTGDLTGPRDNNVKVTSTSIEQLPPISVQGHHCVTSTVHATGTIKNFFSENNSTLSGQTAFSSNIAGVQQLSALLNAEGHLTGNISNISLARAATPQGNIDVHQNNQAIATSKKDILLLDDTIFVNSSENAALINTGNVEANQKNNSTTYTKGDIIIEGAGENINPNYSNNTVASTSNQSSIPFFGSVNTHQKAIAKTLTNGNINITSVYDAIGTHNITEMQNFSRALLPSFVDTTAIQKSLAIIRSKNDITVSTIPTTDTEIAGNAILNNTTLVQALIGNPVDIDITQIARAKLSAHSGDITAEGSNANIVNTVDVTIAAVNPTGQQNGKALLKAGGDINANEGGLPDTPLPLIINKLNMLVEILDDGSSNMAQDGSATIRSLEAINGIQFEGESVRQTTIRNDIQLTNQNEINKTLNAKIIAHDDINGASNIIQINGSNYTIKAVINSRFGEVTDSFTRIIAEGNNNDICIKGDTDDEVTLVNNNSATILSNNWIKAGAGDDQITLLFKTDNAIAQTHFVFEYGSDNDTIINYLGGFDGTGALPNNKLFIDQIYFDNGFAVDDTHIINDNNDTLILLAFDETNGSPTDTIRLTDIEADYFLPGGAGMDDIQPFDADPYFNGWS